MGIFVAFVAAIGIGAIVAAVVGHWTSISNLRQAGTNALRDDLAEFFRELEKLNYVIGDYLQDSVKVEEKRREARVSVLFVYERIRLRLNRIEDKHRALESKLREFIDEPLGQTLADRTKIDEAVELARRVLNSEWQKTKYPWKPFLRKLKKRWGGPSN